MENWKDIKGYEGYYQVSDLGRIKSFSKGSEKILNPKSKNTIYWSVVLCKDGKKKTKRIHSLVAETFLNHVSGHKLVVDHIDNNPFNNKLSNLQIVGQRLNSSKDKSSYNLSSKYVGVSWCKIRSRWVAAIRVGGKRKNLGRFKCELAAAYAYNKKLKEITL